MELIEGVLDFFQRGVDVRQRHRREQAESRRMVLHDLRAEIVAFARKADGLLLVAEIQARIGNGDDGRGGAAPVHIIERFLSCPGGVRGLQQLVALHRGDPRRRPEMMVRVDAVFCRRVEGLWDRCHKVLAASGGG